MSSSGVRNNTTVGWTDNPDIRGTLDIISSCLFTIFACTWSVLHLNIPGPTDGAMTRLLRKIKWMIITVLAPEYIFYSAIRERKWAQATTELLRTKEDSGSLEGKLLSLGESEELQNGPKWTICWKSDWDYQLATWLRGLRAKGSSNTPQIEDTVELMSVDGSGHENRSDIGENQLDIEGAQNNSSHNVQRDTPTEIRLPEQIPFKQNQTSKPWTITHSYYANMDGVRLKIKNSESRRIEFFCITVKHLAEIDFDLAYSPMAQLNISEAEIKDKSKSDSLSKAIAMVQIFWLAVSVIARRIYHITTSQLEILSLAFTALAILIYAAYWDKPQNLGEPSTIFLSRFSDNPDRDKSIRQQIYNISVSSNTKEFRDISSFRKDEWPGIGKVTSKDQDKIDSDSQFLVILKNGGRMENDTCYTSGISDVTFVLATHLFNGLHLLAWNFDFPSRVELMMWRVASLIATFTPALIIITDELSSHNYFTL